MIAIVFWINPRGLPMQLWKINKRKWMEVQTSPSSPSRPQMKSNVHAWKSRLWTVHNVQNYGYHRKNCLIWYRYYIIISPSSHLKLLFIYNSHTSEMYLYKLFSFLFHFFYKASHILKFSVFNLWYYIWAVRLDCWAFPKYMIVVSQFIITLSNPWKFSPQATTGGADIYFTYILAILICWCYICFLLPFNFEL